jgi:hypothetical protein
MRNLSSGKEKVKWNVLHCIHTKVVPWGGDTQLELVVACFEHAEFLSVA